MKIKKDIKQLTYIELDFYAEGDLFHGTDIARAVRFSAQQINRFPMDGTITRYIRTYGNDRREIHRVGAKGNSLYQMGSELCLESA